MPTKGKNRGDEATSKSKFPKGAKLPESSHLLKVVHLLALHHTDGTADDSGCDSVTREYIKNMCGLYLVNDDAGITVAGPQDLGIAIDWPNMTDANIRVAEMNARAPAKPGVVSPNNSCGLTWTDLKLAQVTATQTRGDLVDLVRNHYS